MSFCQLVLISSKQDGQNPKTVSSCGVRAEIASYIWLKENVEINWGYLLIKYMTILRNSNVNSFTYEFFFNFWIESHLSIQNETTKTLYSNLPVFYHFILC